MKKSILTAAVAMALGLSSTNVLAVIDLDTAASEAATYASEIDVENLGGLSGIALDTQVQLGFGFAAGNTDIFARFDLTGGTFSSAITSASLTTTTGAVVNLSAGGAAGATSVVFNIEAGIAGLDSTELLTLALGTIGVTVNAGASNVSLRYRLYTQPFDATSANTNTLKDTVGEQIIKFSQGVAFSTTTNTSVASVSSTPPFVEFIDNTAPQPIDVNTARIGMITLGVNDVLDHTGTSLTVGGVGVILAPATSIAVSGDFGGVNVTDSLGGVWLDSVPGCDNFLAPVSAATLAADQQSAEMVLPNANGDYYVCYKGDGATGFAEETYTVTLNPEVNANYLADKVVFNDVTLGNIKRDGTELQATFMSTANIKVSRFIFLNTGSSDAPITDVKVMMNDGTTYTPGSLSLPRSIPAGKRLAIQGSEIVTGFSAGTAAGVIFSIGATDSNIQGTYQLLLTGSDVQSVVQMVRPGTN